MLKSRTPNQHACNGNHPMRMNSQDEVFERRSLTVAMFRKEALLIYQRRVENLGPHFISPAETRLHRRPLAVWTDGQAEQRGTNNSPRERLPECKHGGEETAYRDQN